MIDLAQRQNRLSYHGNENVESPDNAAGKQQQRVKMGSRAFSTSAIHLTSASSTPSTRYHSQSKSFNSDDNLFEEPTEAEFAVNGQRVSRPNSLERSRSASNNSSPLNLKDSADRLPGRSESLSSEDAVQSREASTLPRDSYLCRSSSALLEHSGRPDSSLPRNGLTAYDTSQKPKIRPPVVSPDSEMVTLEEFLEESNRLSPPSDATTCRDDLLSDYFRRVSDPPAIGNNLAQPGRKDTPKMPTSYVTPTVKLTPDAADGKVNKPGHSVKPSLRHMEPQSSSTSSLRPMQQSMSLTGPRPMTQSQQLGSLSSKSHSLGRAFSLASTDLLRTGGSGNVQKPGTDNQDLTSQTLPPSSSPSTSHVILRERPQSAKVAGAAQGGDFRCRSLDLRRLSLAMPRDERSPSLQPLPSTVTNSTCILENVQQERLNAVPAQQPYSSLQLVAARTKLRPTPRSGEVALVTPVRATTSPGEVEGILGKIPNDPALPKALKIPSDTSVPKSLSKSPEHSNSAVTTEEPNRGGDPKSTPASPDSSGDPQSIWYEYGCV